MTMRMAKVIFSGSFLEYFLVSIGFLFLTAITFGLLLPAWVYWSVRYFSGKMRLEIVDQVEVEGKSALVQ